MKTVPLAESRGFFGTSGAAAKLEIPPSTLDHAIIALKTTNADIGSAER
jgi:hypothetical protein